jgi:hypothetical protein
MIDSAGYGWMRHALQFLFDELTPSEAMAAIQGPDALGRLRQRIGEVLAAPGERNQLPIGDRGDNLLLALLALRSKFEQPVAFEKLEANIAMRSGRDGRPVGDS